MKTEADQFDESMTADPNKAACDVTDRCAAVLSEHWDSVRIICTKHNASTQETASYSTGKGNFYAQLQSARDWAVKQDEQVRIQSRRENE